MKKILIGSSHYVTEDRAGKTVAKLRRKHKKAMEIADCYVACINGKRVRSDRKLKPGDKLQFIQMFGTIG